MVRRLTADRGPRVWAQQDRWGRWWACCQACGLLDEHHRQDRAAAAALRHQRGHIPYITRDHKGWGWWVHCDAHGADWHFDQRGAADDHARRHLADDRRWWWAGSNAGGGR